MNNHQIELQVMRKFIERQQMGSMSWPGEFHRCKDKCFFFSQIKKVYIGDDEVKSLTTIYSYLHKEESIVYVSRFLGKFFPWHFLRTAKFLAKSRDLGLVS